MRRWIAGAAFTFLLVSSSAFALQGKVDLGYTRVDVDVINAGEPDQEIELYGVSSNATINLIHCLCFKPNVVYAQGDADYYSAGGALGAYLPFWDCFAIMPYGGGSYSHMKFFVDLPVFGMFNLRQHFRTRSYYVGFDLNWKPISCFGVSGSIQYAWATINTTIEGVLKNDNESSGFNYFAQADYYFWRCFSVNASVAYMTSRSKERHGSDALGYRIGLGCCF